MRKVDNNFEADEFKIGKILEFLICTSHQGKMLMVAIFNLKTTGRITF